jgi:glutamine amidotransferase
MRCLIVDYGMGNLRSIQHKLKRIGIESAISSSPSDVLCADVLILPGIGHFGQGIANLREYGLIPALEKKVLEEKIPILGICLGMQLFTKSSEEGNVEGLGWIKASTKKLNFENSDQAPRVPHIGWNTIQVARSNSLVNGIDPQHRFYFVHSYYVDCNDTTDVLASTNYGIQFVSVIQRDNIFGIQFHPEKSHMNGMIILKNFVDIAQAK